MMKSLRRKRGVPGGAYNLFKKGTADAAAKGARLKGEDEKKARRKIHGARAGIVAFLATLPLSIPIAAIVGAVQAKKHNKTAGQGARDRLAALNPFGGLETYDKKERDEYLAKVGTKGLATEGNSAGSGDKEAAEKAEKAAPAKEDATDDKKTLAEAIEKDPETKDAAADVLEMNKDKIEAETGYALEELVVDGEESNSDWSLEEMK